MDYRKQFLVEPGTKVKLNKIDPGDSGKHVSEDDALAETEMYRQKLTDLQYLAHAEGKHSMLIVLQGMDAAGKDGVVRHVMGAMNPEGTTVTAFKQPTARELGHDFLWRVHPHVPARGEVAIFNRSHYEDVLVVRVHNLASKAIWSARYQCINDFEKLLEHDNQTHVIKFFLHISQEEQLERFKQRLDDPARNWKISVADYKEREYWDDYMKAYEDVFIETSTKRAPWYIIPSNHKWFRNLAIAQILTSAMEELKMQMPKPQVDLEMIRAEYHRAAKDRTQKAGKKTKK
jgi:PPK2 family polyphosphate:nucleotide phosphotransferase